MTRTRAVGRFLTRALLTIVGVAVGTFLYFVCVGVFAGYPQYHTELLSDIGMILIAAMGGIAWIIDARRGDAGS
jgi:hypothetical protein